MRGGLKLADRGVIPRLLSGIYRRGRKVTKDTNGETAVTVTLSYYEIYNDKVFDLFEAPEKRTPSGLRLCEKDGKTIVVGLSEHACDDLKDFERLYVEANNNRSVGATKLNAESSRSHAILMVKLTQTTAEGTRISTASAIDLAGSEDNRRTENGKERMIESAAINKSLFVLSQCVDAIGRGDRRIPYRESKMTRILSLGQNDGITIMILNLAPLRSYHLDTISSLNVSSRAKRIEVREIENEIVFKQPPRTTSSLAGATMNRQPLRPIANASNAKVHDIIAGQKGDKPLKAFSVFTDKTRPTSTRPTTSVPLARSNSTKKRPSNGIVESRPAKIPKPNAPMQSQTTMSAAKIEEMVERKVAEILAAKARNEPPPTAQTHDISEAVQKRLDALERKIESGAAGDDTRSEGLRFLLMAKQHKERGEDSSALKMYELAMPFFPGQEKLQRKMESLRAKIQHKRDERDRVVEPTRPPALAPLVKQLPTPAASFDVSEEPTLRRNTRKSTELDEDYAGCDDNASAYEDEDSFRARPRKQRSSKLKTKVFNDTEAKFDGELTDAGRHLLDVINSRDVAQIKGLSGVGAKKARDLVEFLELQGEEDGGRIASLRQLMAVPGLGSRTVEKMYDGLVCVV